MGGTGTERRVPTVSSINTHLNTPLVKIHIVNSDLA